VAVNWLYGHDGTLRDPFETTLAARIHEPSFRAAVGNAIVTKARLIKDIGNAAVHETRAVSPDKAVTAVRELFHVAYWLTRTYARGAKPAPGLVFSPQALPRITQVNSRMLRRDLKKRRSHSKRLSVYVL
jgi:type I restriction enzyme, R subunit